MLTHTDFFMRIALGAVLGGVIGFERDMHGRQYVGLRTHLIVAMASATFMVVSAHFAFFQEYTSGKMLEVDGSRIASSVVSGIGFLAGGAILRTGATVQGLTTAAGLWLVSAIGLCAGAGMYIEAILVTLLGVLALSSLRRVEDMREKIIPRRISLTLGDDPSLLTQIVSQITATGATVQDIDYEKKVEDKKTSVKLDIRVPSSIGINRIIEELDKNPGIKKFHVQAPNW